MRVSWTSVAALAAVLTAGTAHAAPVVKGEYVEARSANVYIGACHREGEVLSAGRNAVLAWNITGGEFNGVSLKGVPAVAVVAGEKYLDFKDAKRQSVLYVPDSATPEQREAVVAFLKARAGSALGEVVAVKTAPVRFESGKKGFQVRVAGIASLKAERAPGQTCCKQPYEVWGQPFVAVEYRDAGLLQTWDAKDQNNVFFGEFAL